MATVRTHEGGSSVTPHALVVGGTGMLAGVSLWLAKQGRMVSVVARGRERLEALALRGASREGEVCPVRVDYHDNEHLRRSLEVAVSAHGPPDLAVCWIHSTAPRAIRTVGEVVSDCSDAVRLLHVRGSTTADPSRPDPELEAVLASFPGLNYEVVVLGFVLEGRRSRWLTHDEIASGVIRAIRQPAPKTVVGTLEPWSKRP